MIHFEDAILPLLSFLAAMLAFMDSLKKGVNGYKIAIIVLGLATMGFSIYLEMDKSDKIDVLTSGNETLNKKIENLSTQREFDSIAIDNSDKITRRKIDSAKNSIADSVRAINDFTIVILQKTIREQGHLLDSLTAKRGEKELTKAEKIDILNKILKLSNSAPAENVPVFLNIEQGANYGKFPSQLRNYLSSQGYSVIVAQLLGPSIKGYQVRRMFSDGKPEIDINIGAF